ncbi:MAG: hypothetical protein AMXMBFR84_45730 [Candidatus Hydrogenedentota bacterium]
MVKRILVSIPILAVLALAGCGSDSGSVVEKVKYDFGMGERPEGYVTGSDKVMERLSEVGKTELRRLTMENRHGEVKFQEESALTGKYYKEVKNYKDFMPLDVRAVTHGSQGERGYIGYINFTYEVLQSERKSTRVEAEALSANISTGVTGREQYRYTFSSGAVWDGNKGEPVRN